MSIESSVEVMKLIYLTLCIGAKKWAAHQGSSNFSSYDENQRPYRETCNFWITRNIVCCYILRNFDTKQMSKLNENGVSPVYQAGQEKFLPLPPPRLLPADGRRSKQPDDVLTRKFRQPQWCGESFIHLQMGGLGEHSLLGWDGQDHLLPLIFRRRRRWRFGGSFQLNSAYTKSCPDIRRPGGQDGLALLQSCPPRFPHVFSQYDNS